MCQIGISSTRTRREPSRVSSNSRPEAAVGHISLVRARANRISAALQISGRQHVSNFIGEYAAEPMTINGGRLGFDFFGISVPGVVSFGTGKAEGDQPANSAGEPIIFRPFMKSVSLEP
jgi:hypothetical protein